VIATHACGCQHVHMCNECRRNTYVCCRPECMNLQQYGSCPSCWPKKLRAGEAVGRVVLVLLIALFSFRCAPAVLTVKTFTYGDQMHVTVRYRGKTPPDRMLWEVCQWRTSEMLQGSERAFEADFSCDGGGPAKVTLFAAGHEIATATTERRAAIPSSQW
jgi:hypothetical protein